MANCMEAEPQLGRKTFQRFSAIVQERAGIMLGPNKEALVSTRVRKRMRLLGIPDYEGYLARVETDTTGDELVELLNVISTNVTQFYREPHHFEILAGLLRNWAAAGQRTFRIWCAASSTGEEPYTLAITAREALGETEDVKILATDISTRVLEAARAGLYEERNMDPIPESLKRKHFLYERDGATRRYRVSPAVRRLVSFGRLNLAEPPFPMRGPFDAIFCRNVMIYFDNTVRRGLLAECERLLKPGGYLMVGHAESLSGLLCNLNRVEPSVYAKSR